MKWFWTKDKLFEHTNKIDSEIKLCKDCIHFVRDDQGPAKYSKCKIDTGEIEPVTGGPIFFERYADWERTEDRNRNGCGPEGKNWEAK